FQKLPGNSGKFPRKKPVPSPGTGFLFGFFFLCSPILRADVLQPPGLAVDGTIGIFQVSRRGLGRFLPGKKPGQLHETAPWVRASQRAWSSGETSPARWKRVNRDIYSWLSPPLLSTRVSGS